MERGGILMQITSGKILKAQKVVLYGVEGIGKSTFASKFPEPLFCDTENSTDGMDVRRLPKPTSWQMIMQQADYVKANPHVCKTFVLDTADWAERYCAEHICANGHVKGIEDLGYGKGYVYLEEEFGRLLNKLQELVDLGINVLIIAHATIKKVEQPEEIGGYDHWQMKLEKKTMPLLKEWTDMLLFANYKTVVVNVDNQGAIKGKNKAQGGQRVMYTTRTPWWDAKNRHNLPEELPFGFESIATCIPAGLNSTQVQNVQQTAPTVSTDQISQEPIQSKPEPAQQQKVEVSPTVPRALADLMAIDNVMVREIQKVVGERGYYPADTPIENYDPGFVNGVLVGAWNQILPFIKENRTKAGYFPIDTEDTEIPF